MFSKNNLVKNPAKGGTPAIENKVIEIISKELELKLSPEKELSVLVAEDELFISIQKSINRLKLYINI